MNPGAHGWPGKRLKGNRLSTPRAIRSARGAKRLVNQVSLPSADRLLDAIVSFGTALTWPEAQRRIQAVLERGLQQDPDFERNWPDALGTLLETEKKSA